ncbi:MAG: hypothetical protein DWQ05_23125 [Calditrichaeota bacterium]|nr:MAG: hypothetical protein DWQ05_23125 [Calditrichota bacterium]
MIDENFLSSNDHIYESSREKDLMSFYFRNVEERIASAKSRVHAKRIRDETVEAFMDDCLSDILHDLFENHCSSLIKKYWELQ